MMPLDTGGTGPTLNELLYNIKYKAQPWAGRGHSEHGGLDLGKVLS